MNKWQKEVNDRLDGFSENIGAICDRLVKVEKKKPIVYYGLDPATVLNPEEPQPKYCKGDRVKQGEIVDINFHQQDKVYWYATKVKGNGSYCLKESSVKPLPHIDLMTRDEMLGKLNEPNYKHAYPKTYNSSQNSSLRALEVSLEKWQRLVRIGREQWEEEVKYGGNLESHGHTCGLCELRTQDMSWVCPLTPYENKPCSGRCCQEFANVLCAKDYPAFITACEAMVKRIEGEIEKEKLQQGMLDAVKYGRGIIKVEWHPEVERYASGEVPMVGDIIKHNSDFLSPRLMGKVVALNPFIIHFDGYTNEQHTYSPKHLILFSRKSKEDEWVKIQETEQYDLLRKIVKYKIEVHNSGYSTEFYIKRSLYDKLREA